MKELSIEEKAKRYDEAIKVAKSNKVFDSIYRLWTIEDAKSGDVLASSTGAFIYNGRNDGSSCPGSYCGINTLGQFKICDTNHWTGKKVYPATKEQCDLLFQKMEEAGYEWDAEKKELKKIEQESAIEMKSAEESLGIDSETYNKIVDDCLFAEQNPVWSEEDEKMLGKCIDAASGYYLPEDKQSMKDWLRTLKERYTWKPNKEQIDILFKYAEQNNYDGSILTSLYNDLKKLKGE